MAMAMFRARSARTAPASRFPLQDALVDVTWIAAQSLEFFLPVAEHRLPDSEVAVNIFDPRLQPDPLQRKRDLLLGNPARLHGMSLVSDRARLAEFPPLERGCFVGQGQKEALRQSPRILS